MRTVIFGCPHIQATTTLGSEALKATVEWLVSYCRQAQVTHVVCLGDTVESVTKTDLLANLKVKWVLDTFKALAASGTQVYWLIGNHDVYSEQYSALDIFEDATNFRVLRGPTNIEGLNVSMTLWPFQQWMDDPLAWPKHKDELISPRRDGRPRALFTHCPIENMPMGGTKDQGADLIEISLQYDLIFAGHYHIANQFLAEAMSAQTPVVVPGCLIGHDFKDLGWFHGIVVWDLMPDSQEYPTGLVHWVPNPHAHYFFVGPSAEYQAACQQQPEITQLRDRTHVRFTDKVDAAPFRQWGLPTVQIRPKHTQVQTSSHKSFKLEGDPVEDLQKWLSASGKNPTQELLATAREYLA